MTVTFALSDGEVAHVPNSLTPSSKVITSLLADTQSHDVTIDVTIDVPNEYTPVFDFYLDFLNGNPLTINDVNILLDCFDMESFFADDEFFTYLMSQAYSMWNEFYPLIETLPDERLIYLHSPYGVIPTKYFSMPSFFNEWLNINQNKRIILNGNPVMTSSNQSYDDSEIYRTSVTHYDNHLTSNSSGDMRTRAKKQIKDLKAYHTINHVKFGKELEMGWYENGNPKFVHTFNNVRYVEQHNVGRERNVNSLVATLRKEDGLQASWYSNGNRKYRCMYVNGDPVGVREQWYENGQVQQVKHYNNNGEKNGLWQE